MWRRLGNRSELREALPILSAIALEQGDWERARAALCESLDLSGAALDDEAARATLNGWARLALAQGQAEDAARWLGALEDNADDALVQQSREALGAATFEEAWQRGAALTSDQVAREVWRI